MSKHTPGPWGAFVAGKWDYTIRAADGTPVVRLSDYFGHSEEEREANARLTAAAPELLEALQELLAAETAMYPAYEEGSAAQSNWAIRQHDARRAAREIIARATPTPLAQDAGSLVDGGKA